MAEEIIDGVDVSGCKHCKHIYKNGEGECAAYFLENGDSTVSCSENPNCYYKQMKRLEQENAKLKEALEEIRKYLDSPDFYLHGTDTIHNGIKDKINEVLGAEDE